MIIEKANRTGNCLLLNLKGIIVSGGIIGMRGMGTIFKLYPNREIVLSMLTAICLLEFPSPVPRSAGSTPGVHCYILNFGQQMSLIRNIIEEMRLL
jgi:hypothetical protein